MKTIVVTACLLGLLGSTMALRAETHEDLLSRVRFGARMSCAALARIHAAEFPEAVRVYHQGHHAQSIEEAERAMLGLMWRHRQSIAQTLAVSAFVKARGRSPSEMELRDEESRWVKVLMGYPTALREAIADNCAPVFALAERACPSRPLDWRP